MKNAKSGLVLGGLDAHISWDLISILVNKLSKSFGEL